MTDALTYSTPNKESQSDIRVPDTAERSPEPVTLQLDVRVDYKAKTYKLMKQLTEAEVTNKKSYTQIRHLEMEVDAFKKEFEQIFALLGVNNLQNCYKTIQTLSKGERGLNQQKVEEWTNIIEDYKKIINTQQYKYIKLEQQFKISQVKLKRCEQQHDNKDKPTLKDKANSTPNLEETNRLKEQTAKYKQQAEAKEKQRKSLAEQLALLKREYKQLLVDRENIKEMYEELQNKYSMEIQHFQEMEKHVEERLLQVQREMNFYRFEREGHLEKIELMKQEINLKETKAFFSFGGVAHIGLQTEHNEELSLFNNECMEISIKTLLEENQKLKNTLLILYTNPVGQELPKDIELELKILLNMHDASVKYLKRQDKTRKAEVFEPISTENQPIKEKGKQIVKQENQTKEQQKVQAQSWQSIESKFGVDNRIIQVNEENADEQTEAEKELLPPLEQLH